MLDFIWSGILYETNFDGVFEIILGPIQADSLFPDRLTKRDIFIVQKRLLNGI
jgi:hypothetical protein